MTKKILIIDDEADMRTFLETLFRKGGFETVMAVNGDEALERLREATPDLITLDILMPKKSGLSFYESMCADASLTNVPVIILSGVTGHVDFFADIQRPGPTEFIEKPVKPDVLLALGKTLLGE